MPSALAFYGRAGDLFHSHEIRRPAGRSLPRTASVRVDRPTDLKFQRSKADAAHP